MTAQKLSKTQVEAHVDELLNGKGYFVLPQLFSAEEIKEARDLIHHYSNTETNKATHFQGKNEDKIQLQRRVWNLLNKGDIFIKMVQDPVLMQIGGAFLGDEFCLGSIAANRLLPGGPGQEAHIDYPYWDMYKTSSFPVNVTPAFPMNLQATILLDDFTVENGATAVWPGTQKECRYPTEEDTKKFPSERMLGKAGDVAVFFGLCWHAASDNVTTDSDRSAILIQYLPKFIKPLEDQKRGVRMDIQKNASEELKQLLGFNFPYPIILDQEEGGNAEGRNSEKQHTYEMSK